MAYSDDTGLFVKVIKYIEEELKNAVSATENTQTNADSILGDMTTLKVQGQNSITQVLNQRNADQAKIKNIGRTLLIAAFVGIGRTIDSPQITGSTVNDIALFFRDWRVYQDVIADEKVTARAVFYAAEPSPTANGTIVRCTVDERGQKIESGRHDSGVTVEVTSKPSTFNATYGIYQAAEGPADGLDYQAASNTKVTYAAISRTTPGGLVSNPTLVGNADTADDAAVTVINNWTLTNVSGTPTPKIEKTAAKIFRAQNDTDFAISVSATGTTWKIAQNMPSEVLSDPYAPVAFAVPFYMNTGWTGNITLGWGSKTQIFTASDLTANDWVWLIIDRDADMFPNQFDQDDPEWSVQIESTSANEVVMGGVFAAKPVKFGGVYYWVFSDQAIATLNTKFTMADTNSNAGIIQDTLGFVFDDDDEGAYLMTTGTNTLSDPA